ncbi:hypothetical protein DL766_000360 [Monosporascus sp. MC13-8B]|uniref:CENP-V/GFA domain-containing protein n=1 Tax=Monosporascus cannonballus TaxID=155416 RepID=A0ABY0HI44_9PEZI|nr:hypothetical protein DL762_001670 [Monosporascus cannonballus]RYO99980.1 hypothetical protein DL763_001111 [Monosporascus cannonballus]RYP39538.1 hypothetical protein DL766_000360 [Monosporascus sp. MC13-8B]
MSALPTKANLAASTNIIVPGSGFKIVSGMPKTISKTADSGKQITSHFCGDCGSTLFRDGPSFGDNKVIKAGIMDDVNALEDAKPAVELFVGRKASWVLDVPGAKKVNGMP